MTVDLQSFVEGTWIDPQVWSLRPDYRVLVMAVQDIEPGPSDATSEGFLRGAEDAARAILADTPIEEIPHVASWREAYRAFGAKPQRTRNSLEALLRRVDSGLPRINRLTDLYNAISVVHRIPLGGEDLDGYVGSPRLIRATGEEPFDTTAAGASVTENPEPGEVVWCDDAGVTCRLWNWRQTRRTALREDTTSAVFILDALDPVTEVDLRSAGEDLLARLTQVSPGARAVHRVFSIDA